MRAAIRNPARQRCGFSHSECKYCNVLYVLKIYFGSLGLLFQGAKTRRARQCPPIVTALRTHRIRESSSWRRPKVLKIELVDIANGLNVCLSFLFVSRSHPLHPLLRSYPFSLELAASSAGNPYHHSGRHFAICFILEQNQKRGRDPAESVHSQSICTAVLPSKTKYVFLL